MLGEKNNNIQYFKAPLVLFCTWRVGLSCSIVHLWLAQTVQTGTVTAKCFLEPFLTLCNIQCLWKGLFFFSQSVYPGWKSRHLCLSASCRSKDKPRQGWGVGGRRGLLLEGKLVKTWRLRVVSNKTATKPLWLFFILWDVLVEREHSSRKEMKVHFWYVKRFKLGC